MCRDINEGNVIFWEKSLLNNVPRVPNFPSVLSVRVPKCHKCPIAWMTKLVSALSAQPLKCLGVLSSRVPDYIKCLSAWILSKCPPGARLPSENPSVWVSSENPPSVQKNFRLALTLILNEKHFSEMSFKQIISRF